MRRIYAAFALRIATHQVTVYAALFTLALYVFGETVHVQRIVETLLGTPLGNVPAYVGKALMHGEVLTLIAIGVMVFVGLSIPRELYRGFAGNHTRLV